MLLYLQFPALGFAPSPIWNGAFPDLKRYRRPLLPALNSYSSGIQDRTDENEVSSDKKYKWRLVIAYDGTRYSGWQYQPVTPTIQRLVEEALVRITKQDRALLSLVGAGRTDAGVHAWGQVAHFHTPFNYETLDDVHKALNGILPLDIRVREVSPAAPEFHSRFSVTSKIYRYKIYNDTVLDPFLRLYVYHSLYKLNADLMRDAAQHFIGEHDFSAFANVSRNDCVPGPIKKIFRFHVTEMGPLLQLEVEGTGFLYRQVRNMVALLLQVGRQVVPPNIVPEILASRDRKELAKYAYSVPPHGLCLVAINYNEQHLKLPFGAPVGSFGCHHTLRKCVDQPVASYSAYLSQSLVVIPHLGLIY